MLRNSQAQNVDACSSRDEVFVVSSILDDQGYHDRSNSGSECEDACNVPRCDERLSLNDEQIREEVREYAHVESHYKMSVMGES